jgi:hypothetical protein
MSTKKKPITVASRKAKGRALQDWTCQKVSEVTGIDWGKTDDHEIKPRQMGQRGPDVIMSPTVRAKFPLTIECKNQKRLSILDWIEQAKSNCYPETDWLLVVRRSGRKKEDRTKEFVVLDAEVFFKLCVMISDLPHS